MEALVLVIAVGMILGSRVYCIVSCRLAHTSDERVCLSVGGGGGGVGGGSECGWLDTLFLLLIQSNQIRFDKLFLFQSREIWFDTLFV